MDVIGAIASTAQLMVYGHSASKILLRLIKGIKDGPPAYRDQEQNVHLMLYVVNQVTHQNDSSTESGQFILSIILEISDLATKIHNLLKDTCSFLGSVLYVTARRSTIEDTFAALAGKRDILHLCLSQNIHQLLSDQNRGMSGVKHNSGLGDDGKNMGCTHSQSAGPSKLPVRPFLGLCYNPLLLITIITW